MYYSSTFARRFQWPKAINNTGTISKIEGVSQAKKRKLVNAPIPKLNEEISVGFINYKISICGKQYLEAKKDTYQQKLWHTEPSRHKKILKTSKGDKGH